MQAKCSVQHVCGGVWYSSHWLWMTLWLLPTLLLSLRGTAPPVPRRQADVRRSPCPVTCEQRATGSIQKLGCDSPQSFLHGKIMSLGRWHKTEAGLITGTAHRGRPPAQSPAPAVEWTSFLRGSIMGKTWVPIHSGPTQACGRPWLRQGLVHKVHRGLAEGHPGLRRHCPGKLFWAPTLSGRCPTQGRGAALCLRDAAGGMLSLGQGGRGRQDTGQGHLATYTLPGLQHRRGAQRRGFMVPLAVPEAAGPGVLQQGAT